MMHASHHTELVFADRFIQQLVYIPCGRRVGEVRIGSNKQFFLCGVALNFRGSRQLVLMMGPLVTSIVLLCASEAFAALNLSDPTGASAGNVTGFLKVRRQQDADERIMKSSSLPFNRQDVVPSRTQGIMFDHWNDGGFRGAISRVCWYMGKPTWFDFGHRVIGFDACYAGQCAGYVGGKNKEKSLCWDLNAGESITSVEVNTAVGDEDRNVIVNMKVCAEERCSEKFGGKDWGRQKTTTITCPKGHHVMAFHGYSSPPKATFDGDLRNIGVYCGYGGGSGQWTLVGTSPHDATNYNLKYSVCSTHSKTSTHQITNAWSVSVKAEMKFGMTSPLEEMPDVPVPPVAVTMNSKDDKGGNSITIEGSYSNTIVDTVSESFSTTECTELTFKVKRDRNCYQWVLRSAFLGSGSGEVSTKTNAIECVPSGQLPCCPPGTYTDPYGQSCDPAVYLCKKK